MKNTSVGANKEIQHFLEASGSSTLKTAATLAELICRPELGYAALAPIDKERHPCLLLLWNRWKLKLNMKDIL